MLIWGETLKTKQSCIQLRSVVQKARFETGLFLPSPTEGRSNTLFEREKKKGTYPWSVNSNLPITGVFSEVRVHTDKCSCLVSGVLRVFVMCFEERIDWTMPETLDTSETMQS